MFRSPSQSGCLGTSVGFAQAGSFPRFLASSTSHQFSGQFFGRNGEHLTQDFQTVFKTLNPGSYFSVFQLQFGFSYTVLTSISCFKSLFDHLQAKSVDFLTSFPVVFSQFKSFVATLATISVEHFATFLSISGLPR